MSAVKTALLWLAALVVAALVLRRLRRGDRVVLKGRLSPRLVRMVAVVVVWLGWQPGDAHAAPDPRCDTLPSAPATDGAQGGDQVKDAPTARRVIAPRRPPVDLTCEPGAEAALIEGHVNRTASQRAAALFQVARVLAEKARLEPVDLATLRDLYRDADRRAVEHEAVIAALAEVGPPVFRPWMSKAAPPPGWRDTPSAPPGFRAALDKALQTASAGTWDSEATLPLELVSGASAHHQAPLDARPALIRYGQPVPLSDGARLTLRRLDIVRAGERPLVARHPLLGEITVPAGGALTAWNLPRHLSPAGKGVVAELVAAAGACDRRAQASLMRVLPAAHEAIREALATPGTTPGQPALRLILALFDE